MSQKDRLIKKILWPRIHSWARFYLGLTCLGLFSVLAYLVETKRLINLDNQLFPIFTAQIETIPEIYWQIITWLGNIQVVAPMMIAVTFLLILEKHYLRLTYLIITGFIGGSINYAFKGIFGSARPENILNWFDGQYAFPSGHALIAFCWYLALWLSYEHHILKWPRPILGFLAFLLAALLVLLPFSRLVLGVHWTSDVIGGSLLGLGWTLIVFSTYDRRQT